MGAVQSVAEKLATELDADIFVFNSQFFRPVDRTIIEQVCKRRRRPNIVAIIVSEGGDADVAYRIARLFQDKYTRFTAIISGYCKSAGTLCALGAHELVFGPYGELGPLDIQYAKKDELGEFASGLVVREALGKIQDQAFNVFEQQMLRIMMASEGQISFKLASDVASVLTVGLFRPLYKQIDPILLGELERGMTIAKAYGERLRIRSQNYTSEKLNALAESYSSHGFVIDQREAAELCNNVRGCSDTEQELLDLLGDKAVLPHGSEFSFESSEISESTHGGKTTAIEGAEGSDAGGTGSHAPDNREPSETGQQQTEREPISTLRIAASQPD
jgi:hypothetical protein